jgi:hypothetical protein
MAPILVFKGRQVNTKKKVPADLNFITLSVSKKTFAI